METAYYIAFGAHGPRALPPPGEGWKIAGYTTLGIGVSFALFVVIRMFGKGSPATMTKEYQEATNEYLKVCFPEAPPSPLSASLRTTFFTFAQMGNRQEVEEEDGRMFGMGIIER